MPIKGKLIDMAEQKDVPVFELIRRHLGEAGSVMGAAMSLGVYPNTIRWHVRKNGYQFRRENGRTVIVPKDDTTSVETVRGSE